jgi:hypothetical protein
MTENSKSKHSSLSLGPRGVLVTIAYGNKFLFIKIKKYSLLQLSDSVGFEERDDE